MLKTIPKTDLKLGMYVHDLQVPWISHAFLRSSFMLRKLSDLERIRASDLGMVCIDTLKGLDASEASSAAAADADPDAASDPAHAAMTGETASPADPQAQPSMALLAGLEELGEALPGPAPDPQDERPYQEELAIAQAIRDEADQVIHSLLVDVRMGRQIQVEQLHPVVSRITASILRNPGTLVSLCRIREADTCTFRHSLSSCALMIMFGRHLQLDADTLHEAGVGGMLHDIGKMRVPDHILNKPGKLTDAEYAVMRSHVRLGLETLRDTPGISTTVMTVAAEHHERFDGSGYPEGRQGREISQLGRMAAIVDVYDAITAIRIYHHGIEPAAGLQHLYEWSAGKFDEELVQRFIQAIGIYPVGSLVRLESNRLAVVLDQNRKGLLRPRVRVVYDIGQDRALAPFDLDLADPQHADDGIFGHEEPRAWRLDPTACGFFI
jgi:putative nucleotidyltransferase with HDIG domain